MFHHCTYRSELSLFFLFLVTGDPLPLSSLRLLVPPLQLMVASMWQVLKKQDALTYWTVAEYASLVMDTVPDLLMHKHRLQLLLGLRARVISQTFMESQVYIESFMYFCTFLYFLLTSIFWSCAEMNSCWITT